MADRARTSINPSDQESVPSSIMKMLRDFMMTVDDCLPAIVLSYDRVSNVATVRPVIPRLTVDNVTVPRNSIVNVQVFSFGGGNFHINFPLSEGDLGWIKATDRDLTKFKKELEEAPPGNSITHSFDSSLLLPDVMRRYMIKEEHAEEAVFQSVNGENRIAVGANRIKIATSGTFIELTPGTVNITTEGLLEVTSAESTFSGNVTIEGTATINGRTTMNSGFSSSGGSSGPSSVDQISVNGKPVDGHAHSNPEGGNTGPF